MPMRIVAISIIPNGNQYFSINNIKNIKKMERNDALRVFVKNGGFVMVDHKLQEVKWLRTEFEYDHKEDDALYYVARTTFQKPDGTT